MRAKTRGGWPLAPSTRFPGERTLACPKCHSTDVTMTCRYPVYGTGPNRRGRLGDRGSREVNICNACNHETSWEA